ncbi:MAG TPA: tripartite tricarboxylate transporter substrate binding protein, partial [Casimicrobiaceae bacterium]
MAGIFAAPFSRAQGNREITTLIVGFPPGGPIDMMARALVEPLQKALGNIVIIENRTGAGGRIAVD